MSEQMVDIPYTSVWRKGKIKDTISEQKSVHAVHRSVTGKQ